MALRNQIPDKHATYPDPVNGINLRASEEDLGPGDARLMQNLVFDGGTRDRTGSQRLNAASLGAFKILGGHKFYYGAGSPTSKRLLSYSTKLSVMSDAGSETNLTTALTTGKDGHFLTWPITDKAYYCNGTDTLYEYDGTTFQAVSALGGSSQVPGSGVVPAARQMAPILDRLMCITTNGIERTNARVAHIWSQDSSWATLRGSRAGLFTAIAPFTLKGTDTLYPGIIALQSNAYYVVTGTDFGTDVTAGTASAGEDAEIRLLDPSVGTSSPYAIENVPGLGLFWFTSDLNVYWLPEGSLSGKYIGDKLLSTGSTPGLESTNTTALNQAWMRYLYPYLMLGVPMGSDTYASTQFWLDIRALPKQAVWYGPMTGQTIGRCWAETQNGDNALYGGEGNSATGAFLYNVRKAARFTDAVGTDDNDLSCIYQGPFATFGAASRKKYVAAVHFDLQTTSGTPTCALYDLDGLVIDNVTIEAVTG